MDPRGKDDSNKSKSVRRPRNSFILFSLRRRPVLLKNNPELSNVDISKILGKEWKNLPLETKKMFHNAAQEEKQKHKILHPDYVYSPHEARARKRMKHKIKEEACIRTGIKNKEEIEEETEDYGTEIDQSEPFDSTRGVPYFPGDLEQRKCPTCQEPLICYRCNPVPYVAPYYPYCSTTPSFYYRERRDSYEDPKVHRSSQYYRPTVACFDRPYFLPSQSSYNDSYIIQNLPETTEAVFESLDTNHAPLVVKPEPETEAVGTYQVIEPVKQEAATYDDQDPQALQAFIELLKK